jgi:hypothetical protein
MAWMSERGSRVSSAGRGDVRNDAGSEVLYSVTTITFGGRAMDTSPLALVSIVREREDGTFGTLDPVAVDSLSEDLQIRCLEAIKRYQAEHGTAPNALVIETSGRILTSYQTG